MKKLRFAIIGCGRISYKHVEALIGNREEAELTAVCDIVPEKTDKCIREYLQGIPGIQAPTAYTDYKVMLEKADIDVVAIATESGYHARIAIECMNQGKHVLVEKPMALSIADADMMIEATKLNNVKLGVCHQNRFNPVVRKLRSAIEEGKFGRLINGTARILWTRDMNYYKQAPWRGTWELDGGTLMNQCIHNVDLLQWMLGGEVGSVYAQTDNFIRDIEAEDFGAIIIRFKNKSIGIVEGSACVYPQNLEETLSIFGEKGTVCLGGLAVNKIETWRFEDEGDTDKEDLNRLSEELDSVYGNGHTPLYKDIIDSINMNRDPLIDGVEGKKALSIILAAYKSSHTNSVIKSPFCDISTLDFA